MTVTATDSRVEYAGNGATTAFSVPFRFLANSHLKVYQDGTLKALTTHYTVTGAGSPSGGTVTFLSAPATDEDVVIFRDPPLSQETDYVENDPFPADSHEEALDKLTMICQRLYDLLTRAIILNDSDTSGAVMYLPTPEANKLIGWNDTGTALKNFDASDFATLVGYGSMQAETFTGDGSTVSFELSDSPVTTANCDVAINGITQVPETDYALQVDGVTLTFTSAPANGAVVSVRYGVSLPESTTTNVYESIIIACSDETTALTTGTSKVVFRMPYAFTLTNISASLSTAQTSGSIFTVDINESGASILSTKMTIDNGEKTSRTQATTYIVSDISLADDAEISVDIDQVGDGTAKGLKVTLVGYRT